MELHDGTWKSLAADLRAAGFAHPEEVWDTNSREYFPDATPVLIRYLSARDENVVSGVARALTDKRYREAEGPLIRRFPTVEHEGYRWALGNAIAVVGFADHEQDILDLVVNSRMGMARERLVEVLYKIKDPSVEGILIGLLDDNRLDYFAMASLRRCGTAKALAAIEAMDMTGRLPRTLRSHPREIERLRKRLG